MRFLANPTGSVACVAHAVVASFFDLLLRVGRRSAFSLPSSRTWTTLVWIDALEKVTLAPRPTPIDVTSLALAGSSRAARNVRSLSSTIWSASAPSRSLTSPVALTPSAASNFASFATETPQGRTA